MLVRSARVRSAPAVAASIAVWLSAATCGLQLVPLPPAILRLLSPGAHAVWFASDRAFGTNGAWHCLSLDPPGTEFALATAIVVALFYENSARVALGTRGRRQLAWSIAAAILLFDVVAVLHPLFGLDRLYGVYAPVHVAGAWETVILAPLLNPNHAAAVACVAPPLLMGALAESERGGLRLLAALGAALSGVVAILTLSRSGMYVLGFETLAMVGYALWRRSSGQHRQHRAVAAGVLVAATSVAGALYLALPLVRREATDFSLSKFQLPRLASKLLGAFPLAGIGRGAFASVFPAHQGDLPSRVRYTHAECWPVQFAVEFGIPIALAVVCLLAYALVSNSARILERPTTFGAVVALLGLAIHDLADFASEFIGVGILVAALLAIVTSAGSHHPEPMQVRETQRGWIPQAALALCLAMGATCKSWGRGLDDDTAALAQAWSARGLAGLSGEIAAAARRHPSEPYFPMLKGVQLIRGREAGPYFARAEALGPGWAMNHFWFARWFAGQGRQGQAWAEFREASRLDPSLAPAVIGELIALGAPIDDLISVAPKTEALEGAAVELARSGRAADAASLDERVLLWNPGAIGARIRQIDRAKAAGQVELAKTRAEQLLLEFPLEDRAVIMAAHIQPDPLQAEKLLQEGLERVPESLNLLQEVINLRGRRLGVEAVTVELAALMRQLSASGGPPELPHVLSAQIEIARKRPGSAVARFLDAASVAVTPRGYLEEAARLAEDSGQLGVAEATWRRLADLYPQEPAYAEALARVNRAVFQRALAPTPPN
jgi:tetratricopeptide (TPR) repeat protein